MKKIIIIITAYLLMMLPVQAKENNLVNIYFFHSNNCPHCKEEIKFLESLEKKYNNVKIYKYEISKENNKEIIQKAEEVYKTKINSVPLTIIGDKYYKGYSNEKSPAKIITTIKYYSTYGYRDKLGEKIQNIDLPKKEIKENQIKVDDYINQNSNHNIMFNINSNDISLNTTASLLGIKSTINIINITVLIIISILLNKKELKEKIIFYGIYIITMIFFEILNYIIKENTIFINILIIFLIFMIILKVFYKKNNHIINYIAIIIIVGIIPIMKNIIGTNEINILKMIFELSFITKFNLIINITTYIFSHLITNILLLVLINKINFKKTKLVLKQ